MKLKITRAEWNQYLKTHHYRINLEFVKGMAQQGFSLDGNKHKKRKTNRTIRNLTKFAKKERERYKNN